MKLLILGSLLCLALFASSQIPASFKKDYQRLVSNPLTKKLLDSFAVKYDSLFNPGEITNYRLKSFVKDKLYVGTIDSLIDSRDSLKKALGYTMVVATQDVSKENKLLEQMSSGANKEMSTWALVTLLNIQSKRTTPIFDYLVENEDFGDAHLVPLYMILDKDSLEQTAYKRIHSDNVKAKVLAVQSFLVTGWNPLTDSLIKEAIREWPLNIKGWAIYPASLLGCGDLLPVVGPFVDSASVREIGLTALLNSPTGEDRGYVQRLAGEADTLDSELLNAFYKSNRMENIAYWLQLLQRREIDSGYIFFVMNQPKLSEDSLVVPLQRALSLIQKPSILHELLRALQGRKDDVSMRLLIGFLDHKDQEVRFWAARTLEGNDAVRDETVLRKIGERLKE